MLYKESELEFLNTLSGLLMSGYLKKDEISEWADAIIRKTNTPDDWLIQLALIEDEDYYYSEAWIKSVFFNVESLWYGYRFGDFLWYGYVSGIISQDELVLRYNYHDGYDDYGWDEVEEEISKDIEIAKQFIERMFDENIYESMPGLFEFGE